MAPVLAPLFTVLSRAGIDSAVIPASIRSPGTVLFAVVNPGEFGGRRYLTGEVLVCRGAEAGEPVVLTPRGPGRPMLGRTDGERLRGDAGEPCAPERWSSAGAVERVLLASPAVAQAAERFGRSLPVSSFAARMGTAGQVRGVKAERAVAGRSAAGRLVTSSLGAPIAGVGAPRSAPTPQLALFGKAA